MKKTIRILCAFLMSGISTHAHAEVELNQMPNLSMIQTATVMEVMQALSKPGNKVFALCGNDIVKKAQKGDRNHKLSPECRSEFNRILTKDLESSDSEITELALKITKNSKTNRDKLLAIYDWVTENIQYDVVTYTDLVKNKKIFQKPMDLVSPLKTLETKTAVAEGYSLLTAALLRAVNIPTVTIIGLALNEGEAQGPHAWNEAYIKDRWVNLDTTWDAGGTTGNFDEGLTFVSKPSRNFLDMPDAEFRKTHQAVIDFK